MTAILGVEYDGKVYLGGDSASSIGDTVIPNPDPKVWCAHGVVMGAAGTAIHCQQLRYLLKVKSYRRSESPEKWLASSFIPAVAETFGIKTPGTESDCHILIGVGGRLFGIFDDLGLSAVGPVFAVGSGGDMALAAWDALPMAVEKIHMRIKAALTVPARRLTSVSKPFHIVVK